MEIKLSNPQLHDHHNECQEIRSVQSAPAAFPNSLSTQRLVESGLQDHFSLQSSTFAGKVNEHEALVRVKFSFFHHPLPFLQCRISPPSCLFTCLDRASPILSNVCSPNCKPWSCSFLQHYQNILLLKYLNYQAYVNEFIIHQDQHFFSICSLQRLCWDYGCEKLVIVYGVFSINHLQKKTSLVGTVRPYLSFLFISSCSSFLLEIKRQQIVCVTGPMVKKCPVLILSIFLFCHFFVLSFFCSVNFSSFPRSLIFEWGRWKQEQPTGRTKKITLVL